MRRAAWAGGLVLGVGLLLAAQTAWAVIMRLVPLREVLAESQYIALVKVERLDPDKPAVVLTVEEDFKGKAPFRRLPINLEGDSEAKKDGHTAKLLKRLAPELPLVLFVNERGQRYTAFFYTNGTWFQALGHKSEDAVRWGFTHCEPYLRRTFKGTTAELRTLVVDGLAGKRKPPEPDEKEPPGLGPEVQKDEGGRMKDEKPEGPSSFILHPSSFVFAVIPTVLAGPLALLALLFPAVFGGLMLTMRRWLAALSVVSLNSTLFLAHGWFRGALGPAWWAGPLGLWAVMTLSAFVGLLWAWRRHRAAPADAQPGRLERWVFGGLTLVGLAAVGAALYHKESLLTETQRALLVVWIGVWAGTLALAVRRRGEGVALLSAEGVMVAAMLCGYVGVGAAIWPRGPAAIGSVRVAWEFRPDERGQFLSTPCVVGDRVYVAAAHAKGLSTYGILYCLDRATGKELWRFDDDGGLQQVFSSPRAADGRLYFGEGLHQDRACKVYCLDAATGAKVWEFATNSHTESSPCVADGKVFIGAGDDGIYALDAATGKLLWNYNQEVHIDASPLVANTVGGWRLYVGSGVSRTYRSTEVLCLDASTGQSIWRVPVDLPAWGEPALRGRRLLVGLGNGNLLQSDPAKPAGALLCLDPMTGRRLWRYDVPDGVHARPVAEQGAAWFGCRDAHLYCLDLSEGLPRWKHDLGGPVVAAPARDGERLYAATKDGHVVCLQADSGEVLWEFDIARHTQATARLIASPVIVARGRRQVFIASTVGSEIAPLPVLYCLEDG